ncbi:NAD(P)H-nitrite reductase large subunit [Bacillus mesophilus]|uniref:Nitrite reductase n=1 Tax=Bacillus mesophilus TaxID=1808955 RepID=A0A6M0QBS6_9BACI|nr:nitrite reductase [Bacillus mesophilus]MBM7660150.1 NAD(P)H-nitrite reductase large subunit [Bacillus mesophilus]NEY73803.1 nitrite reductase [Bacillus mesophilus]
MSDIETKIKVAVNGGISFGAKLNSKQLVTIAEFLEDGEELEITTFQQLYVEVPESQLDDVKKRFNDVGLSCYPVGNYIKSLRTCNFCKGAEEEGMPVAMELNSLLAGRAVPFTLRPAYTGCSVGCGEPLVNDIGVMKMKDGYDLYIGGRAKGTNAKVGTLFKEQLTPEQLYETVDRIIELYQEHGKKREPFAKFVERYGFDQIYSQVV